MLIRDRKHDAGEIGEVRISQQKMAERIAREAPNATLVIYPDGNHVCNNIPYKYRPLMADWMREKLV